jgi:hypothetical protein
MNNNYPLLKDNKGEKYLLLRITYREKNIYNSSSGKVKLKSIDLKNKNKEDVLKIFNEQNNLLNDKKNQISYLTEHRLYLSEKNKRKNSRYCYYKNPDVLDVFLFVFAVFLCVFTCFIALIFLYNYFKRFAKSSMPQEKQFCENFELSYIKNVERVDQTLDKNSEDQNIIFNEINHDQKISIRKAKIVREVNHIRCYENLLLEDKSLSEIFNIVNSVSGNYKIKFNCDIINDDDDVISYCNKTMSKKELLSSIKNGFSVNDFTDRYSGERELLR